MTDALPALPSALADRYRLDRELGHGGMATVYLAHDLKHDREVAIKVLRPELAATLGPERFLREITLTAGLNHPHILPLLDSGTTVEGKGGAGLRPYPFYVMPYVQGESLRDRLKREKQLPLEDALQITREVADALEYAHGHHVIHRDIKPENILLESGHAVVADFGIAKALTAAALPVDSSAGMVVGTPMYMSPEQAAGARELDSRSDLYSLGCVLYEMLVGEPPYTGPTPQAILARKLNEPLSRVSVVRDTVPGWIEAALARALARVPADRFHTAEEFAQALIKPEPGAIRVDRRGYRRRWVAGLGAMAVLVAALGIIVAIRHRNAIAGADLLAINDSVVAVLPFRLVSADTGSAVRNLALGLPELFNMRITGEFGPRIAYPPTVQRLWRDAGGTLAAPLDAAGELRLARTVGAGRLIRGSLVPTDTSLVFTAEVLAVPGGDVRVPTMSIEGRWEDRFAVVDRLAWQLLARNQGVAADRLPPLARFKPRAIQAYLAGSLAADLAEASNDFRAALAADSAMIAAALYAYANGESDEHAARYAWEHRDQLTPNQRAYLLPLAGWRFGATHTMAERIAQFRALVRAVPSSAGAWSELGTNLAASGAIAGVPDWETEAARALEISARLGPKNQWTWLHLMELAFLRGDTARARQQLEGFAATAGAGSLVPGVPVGSLVASLQWRLAMLRGDTVEAERILSTLSDSMQLPYVAAAERRGLFTADRVVAALGQKFLDGSGAHYFRWRGQYALWQRSVTSYALSDPPIAHAVWLVRDALFLDGPQDSTAAAEAAFLERVAEGKSLPDPTPDERGQAGCLGALWRLAHGDTTRAQRAVRQLERGVERPYGYVGCVGLITVSLTRARGGDVRAAVRRLDSVMRNGPLPIAWFAQPFPPPEEPVNLTLARLLAQYGDTAAALAASRRRYYIGWGAGIYGSIPEFLREEGRLAALTGDRSGAIRAYTQYLTLRDNSDYPPWQAVRDSVRTELAALVAR